MLIWIHDLYSDADVLINTEYISAVERDNSNPNLFNVRMVNKDNYNVLDESSAAWLTMQK